jgi:superfamily II DNA helicase RecQ
MSSLKNTVPTLSELCSHVEERFGIRPCIFQACSALAQLEQKDCITISPTGSGKTLMFWILLLFNKGGITVVITALNILILGDKNVAELTKLGISTVNITSDSTTNELFKVCQLR